MRFPDVPLLSQNISIGGIEIQAICLVIPVVTLLSLVVLLHIVNHTKTGMAMRAVSKDYEIARVMAVIGGIGNIKGAVLGGFILGLGEILIVAFFPDLSGYRDAFAFIVLIVILFYKPTGLLGEKTTEKV